MKRFIAMVVMLVIAAAPLAGQRRKRLTKAEIDRRAYQVGKKLWPCLLALRAQEILKESKPPSETDVIIMIVVVNPNFKPNCPPGKLK